MNRLFFALVLLAVTSLSGGCASCSTPYDDCGPVFEDGHCRNELIDGRSGSAFAPQPTMENEEETTDVYYEEEEE